jgi:hypothetical protein
MESTRISADTFACCCDDETVLKTFNWINRVRWRSTKTQDGLTPSVGAEKMTVGPVAPAIDPSGSVTLGTDGGAQIKIDKNSMAHRNFMSFIQGTGCVEFEYQFKISKFKGKRIETAFVSNHPLHSIPSTSSRSDHVTKMSQL